MSVAGHRHQHSLAWLSGGRDFDRDEGALDTRVWYLNCGAWRTSGHVHHCGWPGRHQRLSWRLPVTRLPDDAFFSGVRIELHHSAEIVNIVLAPELELRGWEAGHESAFQ